MVTKTLWKRMTDQQLQGANAALRLLHRSPQVRGQALTILKELIEETYVEMRRKPKPVVLNPQKPKNTPRLGAIKPPPKPPTWFTRGKYVKIRGERGFFRLGDIHSYWGTEKSPFAPMHWTNAQSVNDSSLLTVKLSDVISRETLVSEPGDFVRVYLQKPV